MRRVLLLLPLLLLPGCASDEQRAERAAVRGASPTPEPTAEAAPSPSPSPAAGPRSAAEPTAAPELSAVPAPVQREPAAQGDVDGDGEPDVVTVGGRLAVELSGEKRTVTSAFETDTSPARSGAEDVDRDGRAEVFLRTAQGASTTFLTPFRYDGKVLAPLTLHGQQARLGIGGSATHGDGFSCTEAGTLVVRSASSDDGTAFTVTETTYRIEGHRLVQTARSTTRAKGMDDPRVGAAYLVDCRSVGEGG